MFGLGLLGYALFQLAWNSVNQANSIGAGPVADLFPTSATDPSIARISNWSVTLTRGFAAIFVALLVYKVGHKNGVIIGFSLMVISIPFVFTRAMKSSMLTNGVDELTASQASYSIFLIFRIFLAIGGTAVLIYTTPIISKFFTDPKQRNTAVKFSNAPAQIAAVIASIIFINAATARGIAGDWPLIGGIIIGSLAACLVLYLYLGMQFPLVNPVKTVTQLSDAHVADPKKANAENKMSYLLKQPRVYALFIGFAFLTYISIEPSSGVLVNFWNRTDGNVNQVWNLTTGARITNETIATYQFAWQILFSIGIIVALFTLAKWTKTKYSLARFMAWTTIIGLIFLGISYGLGATNLANGGAVTFTLIFGLVGSTFVMAAMAVGFVVPFKWGYNTAQMTNFTSMSWTCMYVIYSIFDIITSYIGTAGVNANPALYSDLVAQNSSLFTGLLSGNVNLYLAISQNMIGWQLPAMGSSFYNSALATVPAGQAPAFEAAYAHALANWNGASWNRPNNGLSSEAAIQFYLAQSATNLPKQYQPQLIFIAVIPIISAIALFSVRRTANDERFSFKHFKENHLQWLSKNKISSKKLEMPSSSSDLQEKPQNVFGTPTVKKPLEPLPATAQPQDLTNPYPQQYPNPRYGSPGPQPRDSYGYGQRPVRAYQQPPRQPNRQVRYPQQYPYPQAQPARPIPSGQTRRIQKP